MSGDFFRTVMGRQFYEGTMPRIAASLHGIWQELKRANDSQAATVKMEDEPMNAVELAAMLSKINELNHELQQMLTQLDTMPPEVAEKLRGLVMRHIALRSTILTALRSHGDEGEVTT